MSFHKTLQCSGDDLFSCERTICKQTQELNELITASEQLLAGTRSRVQRLLTALRQPSDLSTLQGTPLQTGPDEEVKVQTTRTWKLSSLECKQFSEQVLPHQAYLESLFRPC